ncbi:MAG TPA: FAD-dependent monooxygenase [Reyranella sp.]|nr:FAD-dependent monooxygenase [Reyranella sp.]
MKSVPVLIVGGGPVGLAASFLLSRQGVRSLVVERHPGTAIHPKARGINARTMEVFRQHGVEDAVRAAGLAPHHTGLIVWTRTLAGEEIERRVPWRARPASAMVSPVRNCLCAQDDLEPVLRAYAEQQPLGELRFSTAFESFEQDDEAVTATLDAASGETEQIRAQYMIAADGAQSRVRRALGVEMLGQRDVYDSVNILINADLRPWTTHRPAALYFVENPKMRATFLTINAHDRWGFLVNSLAAYGYTASDFTPERSIALVREAAGVPDLPVRVLGVAPWTASAIVADRYRHGRVFLAGDAAHEMPPTGGFGMNTGVQDVHNLAWKLALVVQGLANPKLLDSYHDERQPLGRAITAQALSNAASMGRLDKESKVTGARPEFLNEQGMIFGASYSSSAVVPDGTPPVAVANPVTDYVPAARPGGRAPHVWLHQDGGEPVSTIDLVGNGFVLLAGARGQAWQTAAVGTLPIKSHVIADAAFGPAYGIDDGGAVLVRPDGYVAWRSATLPADPQAALRAAAQQILSP